MRFVTLCENSLEPCFGLKAAHGLSLYIEYKNERFIYDIGPDDTCLENAKRLGIDMQECKKIIISHGHLDHAGGLEYLKNEIDNKELIIHEKAFEERLRQNKDKFMDIGISNKLGYLKKNSKKIVEDFEIFKGAWVLTNIEMPSQYKNLEKGLFVKNSKNELKEDYFEDELCLAFDTPKGLVVVSGCSHRGVINILKHAQKTTGKKEIYAFIGGMHLRFASEEDSIKTIDELKQFNIKKLIIGHCTGNDATFMMKQLFQKETEIITNYVGYEYEEDDLDEM